MSKASYTRTDSLGQVVEKQVPYTVDRTVTKEVPVFVDKVRVCAR
jgi:hypothetical protein